MSLRRREPVITSTALDPLFDYADDDEEEEEFYDDEQDCRRHNHRSRRSMRSPLSSPPSSPESLLARDASLMSTLTPPMPISVPAAQAIARPSADGSPPFSPSSFSPPSPSSSSSSSRASFSSASSSSSSMEDARSRMSVWHMMETHQLASKARRKLVAEASRSEHKLRFLVGHANFLDACLGDIQNFDEEALVFDEDERGSAQPHSDRGRTQQRRGRRKHR